MQSEYSGKEAELVPGALRGYRMWRVEPHYGLVAMNFPVSWVPGVNTAACANWGLARPFQHKSPSVSCMCGFYARHNLDSDFFRPTENMIGSIKAYGLGSIKAYGHVILGDLGFRAQYAEIEALILMGSLVPRLSDYGVPIFGSVERLLEEFPPIPVDSLLKEETPSRLEEEELLRLRARYADPYHYLGRKWWLLP